MLTKTGNIWSKLSETKVIFITTNLCNNKAGEAVMGAGIALEAKRNFPEIAKILGKLNSENKYFPCYLLTARGTEIWSFPTKGPSFIFENSGQAKHVLPRYAKGLKLGDIVHSWQRYSTIERITDSAKRVAELPHASFCLTPPGCGNGGLSWEKQVRPVLTDLLDERFTIYNL